MIALRIACAATLLIAASATSFAKVRTPSADDKLQAACYPEVQRLCKDAIPDEGKIRICMERQKDKIGKECVKAAKDAGE